MKVLVTGASGFVGNAVCKELEKKGHEVLKFSRSSKELIPHNVEAVINLAGENVGERWSGEKKKRILESRTDFVKNLSAKFEDINNLEIFISSSAVGFYGNRNEEILSEDSSAGSGFLADVCLQWEKSVIDNFSQCRTVLLRTGVVLGNGGALKKMRLPFQLGLGSALGSGKQWMSWIDLQDLAKMYVFALENEKLKGIFNSVAPNPVTNLQFSQTLAKSLHRPLLPVAAPEMVLRMALGEMAAIVLDSQRVSAEKILGTGFQFQFNDLSECLKSRQ